jgi:hypothetical protein
MKLRVKSGCYILQKSSLLDPELVKVYMKDRVLRLPPVFTFLMKATDILHCLNVRQKSNGSFWADKN